MSGVYIKGMKIPKTCDECCALDDYGDYPRCRITEEQRGYNFPITEKRMDKCPLVPVPEHGDLIDRGYAIATACSGRIRTLPTTEDGENWIRVEEVRESIKNAPTIIPAEPKEET